MNNLSVSEVKFFRESRGVVTHGFNIERPVMSDLISGDLFVVSGWIIGKTSRAVEVNVLLFEEVIAVALVNINRPDVERAYPAVEEAKSSGFRASIPVVSLQGASEINVIAKLADGTQVPLANIYFEKQLEARTESEEGSKKIDSISDRGEKPGGRRTQVVFDHRSRKVGSMTEARTAIEEGSKKINSISDQVDKPHERHTQVVLDHGSSKEVDNISDQGGAITRFINRLKAKFNR